MISALEIKFSRLQYSFSMVIIFQLGFYSLFIPPKPNND